MDHSFFLRAQRMLERERPAGIDHRVMVAALAAHQSSSRTARIAASERGCGHRGAVLEPLPELVLAGRWWRQAAAAQAGCFNRSIAGRPVNGS